MEIIIMLVPIIVGAAIGYFTNYIAIKMLFRPSKALYIGKFRVPFTPGVIPKNQSRIAKACGNVVAQNLVTAEAVKKYVSESFNENNKLSATLSQIDLTKISIESMCNKYSDKSLNNQKAEDVLNSINDKITEKIVDEIKKIDIKAAVTSIANNSFSSILQNPMLKMFLGQDFVDGIAAKVEKGFLEYLDENGREEISKRVKEEVNLIYVNSLDDNIRNVGIDRDKLCNGVSEVIINVISEYGEKLVGLINIQKIVEDNINQMDVKELETLVLSVMKQELNTVVNLGALIGAVIGMINIFVHN